MKRGDLRLKKGVSPSFMAMGPEVELIQYLMRWRKDRNVMFQWLANFCIY